MGNASSAEREEDLDTKTPGSQEDAIATGENLLDFSVMFELEGLHKALLNVREPLGTAITRNKENMVKWLKGLVDRDETTVNIVQFVDFLTGKGATREEAVAFFVEVDREGEGVVEIPYMLSTLKEGTTDPMQALLPCHILPGPVDVYTDDKTELAGAGKKLVQFLQCHRVGCEKLSVPSLDLINSTLAQREKLVVGRYHSLLERENDEALMEGGAGPEEGVERMIIRKCYSKISVSTNQRTQDHVTDGRTDTYWQSNGSPRSHWLRIHMLPGVMVKELAISVDSSDDSYMPRTVAILVGSSESSLKEIKTVTVPRETVGRHVLLRSLGVEHRIIQMSFRSCYSDGCDTRIRGVHIKGCKYAREVEPTVLDTMATWYLSIVASTAKAAMPVAPQLRESIISQSKAALRLLHPLSLSPSSPARPEFLSPFVVAEMDKFLNTLCLPGETFVSVDEDSLIVLLSFALAHGSVNSMLDCLHILLDNLALELPLAPLLHKLEETQREKKRKHAESLKVSLVRCDGGQKDDSHRPQCMLSNEINSTTPPYLSDSGKKVVNVLVKEDDKMLVRVTRVVVKVGSGGQAPRGGLVFLFDHEDAASEAFLEQFSQYDGWGPEEYQRMREESTKEEELAPIAYFEPDKDTHEAEVTPDVLKTGRYLLLKFLSPSQESEERVGVHCVKVFGHRTTPEEIESTAFLSKLNDHAPLPPPSSPSTLVEGGEVLVRVLAFLAALLRDLAALHTRRKAASLDPSAITEPHLAVDNLSLEKIWSLYIPLTLNTNETLDYASILCLYVLRAALPFIRPPRLPKHPFPSPSPSAPLEMPSAVLAHLCGLLDSDSADAQVKRLAQDIVVEGVVLFFPDATARRNYLLSMIDSVMDDSQPRSWWLKFEALCHYFSKTDSNSLLGLPRQPQEDTEVNTEPTMNLLTRMLAVVTREAHSCVKSSSGRPEDLVQLLCALQSSLFFWCRKHIAGESEQLRQTAATFLQDYTRELVAHCCRVLKELAAEEDIPEATVKALQKTLVGRTLPEMLAFLSAEVEGEVERVHLLHSLLPLVDTLHSITTRVPGTFLKVDSEVLQTSGEGEAVVGVWIRESAHNYENNARINEEFVCPAASKFTIEFDSRCRTERRYDYLQFTDTSGQKHQFDDTVGSERWPTTAEFVGPKLHFLFHSDGSNNDWGYKFTLKAVGKSIPPLGWLFDLQISLARLLGLLCSATLSTKTTHHTAAVGQSNEQKEEESLVHSDLWKTLFRGGYMVGKLTRSLSGAYAASPADSALSILLLDLAHGPEGPAVPLLEICRASSKGPFYGGPLVDKAVNAVFAALIWHCQDIREELAPFASEEAPLKATAGLLAAFSAAEAMRRELVEGRQKLLEAKEKEEEEDKKAKINEDAPVVACHEKAEFLLKFSGLSRVGREEEEPSSPMRPSWVQKSKKWQKVSQAVSTVGKLKQQLQGNTEREKLSEKYPSFELVLNFVKNEIFSVKKVHSLLHQRSRLASSVAQVYTFAAEYIRLLDTPSIFELPGLAFLQQLLAKQNHFPGHYASKLDGCGLELESQVRRSYRMLLHRLLDALSSFSKPPTKEHSFARLLVSLYLVHLLDCEWQGYDYTLLSELQLPDFLFQSAIKSSSTEEREQVEKFQREEELLVRYKLHMRLLERLKEVKEQGGDYTEFLEQEESQLQDHEKAEAHLFLVASSLGFPEVLTVQCDGCGNRISGCWFRNMEIETDCDLCTTCFNRGTGNRPDSHTKDHLYQCIGSFRCDGCKIAILTHRFHSNTRFDYDLCLGCLRKEEAEGRKDHWTVYLLTEQPATDVANKFLSIETKHIEGMHYHDGTLVRLEPAVDLMVYNQQHCWILFSALCMALSSSINSDKATEVEYVRQACSILLQCLRLISFGLRAAILAKREEERKKKEAEEIKAKQEPPKTEETKREEERGEGGERPVETGPETEEQQTQQTREQRRMEVDEELQPPPMQQEATPTPQQEATPTPQQEATPTPQPEATPTPQQEATPTPQPEATPTPQPEATPTPQPEATPTPQQEATPTPQQKVTPTPQQEVTLTPQQKATPTPQREATPTSQQEATPTPQQRQTVSTDSEAVPPEPEDPLVATSRQVMEEDTRIGSLERTFGALATERMLGLLAAVLPAELSLSCWIRHRGDTEVFLAEKLLPTLLHVSGCREMAECRRALLVAAQYMARVNPEVADRAVEIACGRTPVDGEKSHGLKTVDHLFSTGAAFLKKSDFTGAATAAECLLLLSKALPWKSAITLTISHTLETKPEDMDLSSIFGLLVIAGFPKIPCEGSVLRHLRGEEDEEKKVLTSVQPGGEQGLAIDLKTREPTSVRLADYEVEDSLRGCIDISRLPPLIPLLRAALQLTKQDSERQVEYTWILALGLKALNVVVESPSSEEVVKALLSGGLVPAIVKLASKPTRFSQKWHLADLEVLGIRTYQPAAPKKATPPDHTAEGGEKERGSNEGKEGTDEGGAEAKPPPSPASEDSILEGLPDEIQDMLKIMKEAFQCRLSVLRALYEAAGSDVNQFIMSSEQYYDIDEGALKPPSEILEAAKKWDPHHQSVKEVVQDIQDSLEDMGVTRLSPVDIDIKSIEAVSEDLTLLKKQKSLFREDSQTGTVEKAEHSREDSSKLLQEEISKLKDQTPNRAKVLKTQQAIVVLQARQVLASLLANWPPSGPRLSSSALGSTDTTQYFCLLDLLLRQQSLKGCEKILHVAIHHAEPTEVVSLALTAAQCMREVAVGRESRELRHPGTNSNTETGKIVISNASSLTVQFHPVKGEVEFSSKEDFSEHTKKHTATSTDPQDLQKHLIPGNTLHYKVTLEAVSEAKHPKCTFTVTGTQMGRFDTGHAILRSLLCDVKPLAACLPLTQLWPNLIAVACQHTGQDRLKVIQLLMELLNLQRSLPAPTEKLELPALKPLWQLYTTLMKEYDEKSKNNHMLAPEIVRAFTELFLTVENQAVEWNVSQDLMVETLTREGLHTWLEKGISNVAFLSLGLGLDNLASRAFTEAKHSYVPPAPQPEVVVDAPTEEEDSGGESSPESEDSSDSYYSDSD